MVCTNEEVSSTERRQLAIEQPAGQLLEPTRFSHGYEATGHFLQVLIAGVQRLSEEVNDGRSRTTGRIAWLALLVYGKHELNHVPKPF
jgi:hypothetical protein